MSSTIVQHNDDAVANRHVLRAAWVYLEIGPWDACHLDPSQVREAIGRVDLASLDLLLVENLGTMIMPPGRVDFGQDATVAVFSVAAGDDKARRHPEMIEVADAVMLNKADLAVIVPSDVRAFKADVDGAEPGIGFFAVSVLAGRGLEPWLDWLRGRATKRHCGGDDVSHWFG